MKESSQEQIKVALVGAGGRMGLAFADYLGSLSDHHYQITGVVDKGKDISHIRSSWKKASGKMITSLSKALQGSDVAIEFINRPADSIITARACADEGCPLLIGTTGHDPETLDVLHEISKVIPLLITSNTSLGVNLLVHLLEKACRALPNDFDVEIIEAHHRGKMDAPSGTAKTLLEAVYQGRDNARMDVVFGRRGICPRESMEVGIHALRLGKITGEHTVRICSDLEEITLGHRAADRAVFVDGALKAARFLASSEREPGLYTMSHVLGLGD
ncbi:MAG: 4-hydroxy-tetrahydrodipicolinate reductase [Candidatus Wallbacteria bacterium HGW-Wallbacteria-1]|uniref:4-hydroxy-tetrahydrodipicolinate reductase n=1 Tax=Candidatus Wallbacteria bacterium HGW-Wallbacteria-1 TaxID=2013854 RepID=A0A2N1PPR3_9BACT|nr:MAG: 4-hydroxy-tetrahydrodipicolinate reductase [Candidatus Wallbacteria bacterium HGW-Wallbacteria-1]